MQTTKIFLMAALALMTAACSNDDTNILTPAEQPAKAEGIPFTATISMGESASTRALTEDTENKKIVATWETGEKVALIYTVGSTSTKTDAEVTKQADGTATISATLASGATNGSAVTIIYPSTAADGTTGNVKANLLTAQDGTLATIAANYDVRKGTGKLSINAGGATVNNGTAGTPVALTNQNAIFKLTLKDIDGASDVSANSVIISDQTGVVTTVTPASGYENAMYVALPTTATTLKFLVTGSDSKKYFNMASSLTLSASYYQSTIKLATVGHVIASNGKCYKDDAATPGGNTAVAKICYLDSDNGEAAPYNHGLALALSDADGGNTCKWSTSTGSTVHTYYTTSSSFTSESGLQYNATHNTDEYPAFKAAIANNGTAAPTGCSSWFLASGYQWTKMFAGDAGGLKTLAGLQSYYYWSSSERDADRAWRFYSDSGYWLYGSKDIHDHVRACLAF